MQFEQLFTDFMSLTEAEQEQFFTQYKLRRNIDLDKIPERTSKKSLKETLQFTEEELALMKTLGLKPKDLKALKAVEIENDLEEEEDLLDGDN
jgi:hypothetical protein